MQEEAVIEKVPSGFTIWLTGLSSAGKTTLSRLLESLLAGGGRNVEVLDGETVRKTLGVHGFTKEARDNHVRHLGFMSNLLSRNGVIVIVASISPYRSVRDEVRAWHGDRFVEVFLSCPMETLIARDSRDLYRRALSGEIRNFTGISDPYEQPVNPEIVLHTDREAKEQSAQRVIDWLIAREFVSAGVVSL
jgi:adenylylsulfate kinase